MIGFVSDFVFRIYRPMGRVLPRSVIHGRGGDTGARCARYQSSARPIDAVAAFNHARPGGNDRPGRYFGHSPQKRFATHRRDNAMRGRVPEGKQPAAGDSPAPFRDLSFGEGVGHP